MEVNHQIIAVAGADFIGVGQGAGAAQTGSGWVTTLLVVCGLAIAASFIVAKIVKNRQAKQKR